MKPRFYWHRRLLCCLLVKTGQHCLWLIVCWFIWGFSQLTQFHPRAISDQTIEMERIILSTIACVINLSLRPIQIHSRKTFYQMDYQIRDFEILDVDLYIQSHNLKLLIKHFLLSKFKNRALSPCCYSSIGRN